jgi:4-amino-4-deoxy-L-arabinose transferase-like glycosyltransferase
LWQPALAMRATSRWPLLLLGLALLAGALRIGVGEWTAPVQPVGDEIYYLETAGRLAGYGEHYSQRYAAWAAWPPGNAWWLSHFSGTSGTPGAPARRAQALLGTLLVVLTALLGRRLFDARTGLLAGCVAAVDPTFVAFGHYFWAAPLYTVLLLVALWGCVAAHERDLPRPWVALTGIAFGAAALTRESGLAIAAGCATWWIWTAASARRLRALLRAALLLGVALLVVAPWTLRNHAHLGQWVPVSNVGWLALAYGNSLGDPDWLEPDYRAQAEFGRAFFALDEVERPAFAREQVRSLIAEEQPLWIFKKTILNLALLFRPDSTLFLKLSYGAYGDVPPALLHVLVALAVVSYVVIVVLAILGAAASREPGRGSFLLCAATPLVALHVLAFAGARYRFPLMPLLMIYASHAALHAPRLLGGLRGRRALAAAAALLFFLGVCIPHFRADGAALWSTGSYLERGTPAPQPISMPPATLSDTPVTLGALSR